MGNWILCAIVLGKILKIVRVSLFKEESMNKFVLKKAN